MGAEIRKAEEALDRYFLAFENGTMSEERCAPRIEALSEKLQALKARQIELSNAVEDQRVLGPSPEELAAIRSRIGHVISSGPDGARKALLQDMVSEVRVRSRRSIVPSSGSPYGDHPRGRGRFDTCPDWWRRRELNPRPKQSSPGPLRAYPGF